MSFKYVVADPNILGGKPIIKGTRISVEMILEWLATGPAEEIMRNYPLVSREAIHEVLLYASKALKNEIILESKKDSESINQC